MLAAAYTQPGPDSTLTLQDLPTPTPGPGEVRVKLTVAGVNPTDWKLRSGLASRPASLTTGGAPAGAPPVQVPGQDGAGVIDALGPSVSGFAVGDRVWTVLAGDRRWGTAAQYTVQPVTSVVALPDSASFELGASLGVPAVTAAWCLSDGFSPRGQVVLVSGGAGAVGNAAIALAKFEGAAVVIATVSGPEKGELARAAGADVIVNYRDRDAAAQIRAAAPDGVARIVEVDLTANLELDLAVVRQRATIVCYAADPTTACELPMRRLMGLNLALQFMVLYDVPRDSLDAAIARVSAALTAGALRETLPLHRFPLAQAAAAHDAVQQGAVGKVLIDIP